MTNDHVLPNGYTFLAVTTGPYGSWAKATDPITAIKNAAASNGSSIKAAVQCWFGPSDKMRCGFMGGISWEEVAPVPIGLFLVSKSSIKPLPKGTFNNDHQDHDQFMVEMMKEIQETVDSWD